MTRERETFARENTKSLEVYARAKSSLLAGVPMNWMQRWAGGYPIYVADAAGAQLHTMTFASPYAKADREAT